MARRHDTGTRTDDATDDDVRRYYQAIVKEGVTARFHALFARLRAEEKELEHEG